MSKAEFLENRAKRGQLALLARMKIYNNSNIWGDYYESGISTVMMILLLLKQKKMAINCDCAGEVVMWSILTFLEVRQTGAWLEAGKPQSWMMVIFLCIYVAANVQSKKKIFQPMYILAEIQQAICILAS